MRRKFAVTLLALSALCTGLTLAACGEKGPTGDGGEPGGDAQGHVHELTYVAAVEATCTEAGSLEYWTCSDCSKNFADENAAEELSNVAVPAKGHTFENGVCADCGVSEEDAEHVHKLTFVEGKEPTCTEPGSLEYWTCSDCGKNFADVYASKEISDITIPTKEHTPGEAATCTEPQTCTVCGEVIAPKTEHHYENGVCVDCGEKEDIFSEGLEFALLGNSYAVSGIGTCTDTDLVIPSVYNGLPVTVIWDDAFEDCTGLTSVAIPDSVTTIGAGAFRSCVNLTSVMIGNSATSIGGGAFASCSALTSITIPDSVTSIGRDAFFGTAYYNDEQNWENSVLYIGKYLIEASRDLSGNYTIKGGTVLIADGAVAGCFDLTSVTIPDSVTSIGEDAFYWCKNLTNVTIPNSVTSIGSGAFAYCESLTSITIPDSVTSIGEYAFYGCDSLTSITIGNSVTVIGDSAFTRTAYYINEQNWENGVLYIGKYLIEADSDLSGDYTIKEGTALIADYAFSNCHSLTSITIPDGVTSIGDWAFSHCDSLTSIDIPDSVTSIGPGAFADCENLTSITVSEGNPVYHSAGNCIIETSSGTLIAGCNNSVIPNDGSVTSIGYCAFYGCESLTSITIPDSVTSIGEGAFAYCDSLTSITIPNSVTSIGVYVFNGCTSLTSITIGDSVTSIGEYAFAYCESLTSITIPDSVTSIGSGAFSDCDSLTSITIPDSVTSIGEDAFHNCDSLVSVTIGDSVTSIGWGAFDDCDSLTTVYYNGTEEEWNNIDIEDYNFDLTDADIYYYSESEPSDGEGNYWHYDENGVPVIW